MKKNIKHKIKVWYFERIAEHAKGHIIDALSHNIYIYRDTTLDKAIASYFYRPNSFFKYWYIFKVREDELRVHSFRDDTKIFTYSIKEISL